FSCYVRYYIDVKMLFKVPAEAFDPVPKVDSAVISMAFDDRYEKRACDEKKLFDLINFAFSQRRKKVINVLKQKGVSESICIDCGIKKDDRAENVSLKQYIELVERNNDG
ncbi:MAG: rRNA adenine N-6-methyltransferase family protein, partial [Candidatus Omnitrophica bacterium]|nr:rRNA adenine N-6-methyltransferase family protein [Candidatus Omnitrophota bacterium]